jgi:hypothetical protein
VAVQVPGPPAGTAFREPDATTLTGGEDQLRTALLACHPGPCRADQLVDPAALEPKTGGQFRHFDIAAPEEGIQLSLRLGAKLVAVDRRAGLRAGQLGPVQLEDPARASSSEASGIWIPASQA